MSVHHSRTPALALLLAAIVFVVAACQTSPLSNPNGTSQGLAAITSVADKSQAKTIINTPRIGTAGSMTGYSRTAYGPAWTDVQDATWGHNGCDTRDDILKRDMDSETFGTGDICTVLTGTLDNPYKGNTINFVRGVATSGAVQIDHVYALGYSWEMGASSWTTAQRRNFANDPLNLLAVDGSSNASKGDKSPAAWLPSNTTIDCSYSVRFAQVAVKYSLPVSPSDKAVMLSVCS